MNLGISAYTLTTALGTGNAANLAALQGLQSGLAPVTFDGAEMLDTWAGEVQGLDNDRLAPAYSDFDCRNNRLADHALVQDGFAGAVADAISQYGPARVGLMLGTSTSGIRQAELAYRISAKPDGHEPIPDWFNYNGTSSIHSLTRFVKHRLGIQGYSLTISTACSSSARVFASAERAIAAGLCDAVVVGGVDSLCETTLHGFHSLQLTSSQPCRPCDAGRDGISIGEAGGFALLTRQDAAVHLLGTGESADAHHMSSPHPEGKGALIAMQAALSNAGLTPADIGYVNLHGTGTPANDTIECRAVSDLLGNEVPCSSTKGFTGHTLGACGIVEAIFGIFALTEQFLPANLNLEQRDSEIPVNVVNGRQNGAPHAILSNSFGFGGNNASLVLAR